MGYTADDMKRMGLVRCADGKYRKFKKKPPVAKEEKKVVYSEVNLEEQLKHYKKVITFDVMPMGKPRMTQSDKWNKRKVTDRYWRCKDMIKKIAKGYKFEMVDSNYWLIFYIPVSRSWKKDKKKEHIGKPHRMKPDKDNLEKGFLDALCKEDSHIWDGRVSKFWCKEGDERIELYVY